MSANLENSAVTIGLEKVNFHPNAKESSNYCTVALMSHASKIMLKILQTRLQQYVNQKLPDGSWVLKQQRNQKSYCQHVLDFGESKGVPGKHPFLLY